MVVMPNQYKISVCNLPNDLCVRAWTGGQLQFVLSMHEALDSILSTKMTAKKNTTCIQIFSIVNYFHN